MKRLIVCCDGTWQSAGDTFPTNIAKIASALCLVDTNDPKNPIIQEVYYNAGVGTNGTFDKLVGGAFGAGIDLHIKDAYRFLCLNYACGKEREQPDEIYLFGYSRGAYIARSLAGLIYNSGLLRPEHIDLIDSKGSDNLSAYELYRSRLDKHTPGSPTAESFRKQYCVKIPGIPDKDSGRVPITLLACFDTVGALGIPALGPVEHIKAFLFRNRWFKHASLGKYRFYDEKLSRIILNALHAVSVDEEKVTFPVTPMIQETRETITGTSQKVTEVWFPGNHLCLGGGEKTIQPLSNNSLFWMLDQVKKLNLGLAFDITKMTPDGSEKLAINYKKDFPKKFDPIQLLGKEPRTISDAVSFDANIHQTVKKRWRDYENAKTKKRYRPKNITQRFEKEMDSWIESNPG